MFEKLRLRKYTSQIKKTSEAFKTFLNDYFTGHPMIRGRGEEDATVWTRMNGEEVKVASQMILDKLGHDYAYIKAVACFRDERAIPLLENLIEILTIDSVMKDWLLPEFYLIGLTMINISQF